VAVRLLEDTLGKDPGGHQPTLVTSGPPFVLALFAPTILSVDQRYGRE
jgi:hypothetical protein